MKRTITRLASLLVFSMAVSCAGDGVPGNSSVVPVLDRDAPDMSALSGPWLYTDGPWIMKKGAGRITLRGLALPDLQAAENQQYPRLQPNDGIIGLLDLVTNQAEGWYPQVIRLTVWPNDDQGLIGEPGWIPDPEDYYNNYLKPATDYCRAKGLYYIIDWHWIVDYTGEYVDAETRKFWSFIAPKYAGDPYALFELFNEPIGPKDWSVWRGVAQGWVDLIRELAPYNLILVGSPWWSSDCSGAVMEPVTGGNIVYTCHIYPPTLWSQYDAQFGNAAAYRPVIMTEWTYEHPDPAAPLATAINDDESVTDGIQTFDPVYGPEPGIPSSNGYGDHYKEYLEAHPNIGWTYWCADNSWQKMFDENWNLRGGNFYSGEFAKRWLYEKRP